MHKKINRSFATRLSLRFMFILTGAVIMLALGFLFILRFMVRGNQVSGLKNAEAVVFKTFSESEGKSTEDGAFFLLPDIPYFLTYIVYDPHTEEVLATNDPFLPLLKDTRILGIVFVVSAA